MSASLTQQLTVQDFIEFIMNFPFEKSDTDSVEQAKYCAMLYHKVFNDLPFLVIGSSICENEDLVNIFKLIQPSLGMSGAHELEEGLILGKASYSTWANIAYLLGGIFAGKTFILMVKNIKKTLAVITHSEGCSYSALRGELNVLRLAGYQTIFQSYDSAIHCLPPCGGQDIPGVFKKSAALHEVVGKFYQGFLDQDQSLQNFIDPSFLRLADGFVP